MESAEKYDIKDYSPTLLLKNNAYRFLLNNIKPNSKVLEFGSATGYITRFMKEELRCQVTCIEIDPVSAEKCKPYAEKVIVANLDTDKWEDSLEGKFDIITFFDVIEHLKEFKLVLNKAEQFLKSDGFIITSIPNITHNAVIIELLRGNFNYMDTGLLDSTHVHFFTREHIFQLFNSLNFVCKDEFFHIKTPVQTEFNISYWNMLLLSPFLALKRYGHVYQFQNIWTRKNDHHSIRKFKEKRPQNYLNAIIGMCLDLMRGLKRTIIKFSKHG